MPQPVFYVNQIYAKLVRPDNSMLNYFSNPKAAKLLVLILKEPTYALPRFNLKQHHWLG
jgi:hypothetical protein